MKTALIALLLVTSSFVLAQNTPTDSNRAADEQAILKQRDAVLKAYDEGDVKTLDQIEDADFTLAGDFGQMTKQQHLDQVRHRAEPQRVTRKIDNQFRFYGDVALLTEVDHASASDGHADYQTTIVWVRRGDTWKVVHMHYSLLGSKP